MFTLDMSGFKTTYNSGFSIERENGTPHYVFVYYRTPGEYFLDGVYAGCTNCYILLEPGVPHSYRARSIPYVDDWVHFYADEKGIDFISELGICCNRPVAFSGYEKISGIIQELERLGTVGVKSREIKGEALIISLLTAVSHTEGSKETKQGQKYYSLLNGIKTGIYRFPESQMSLSDLADKAGLSVSRFSHLYKEYFGNTPGEDIAFSRLERAKYLLETTGESVSSIAEKSGYSDEIMLIRHFNKYLKLTPSKYRRQMRD